MSIETTTSGLPALVPFAEQHQRQPDRVGPEGGVPWGRCSCGARWKPTRSATSPWEAHLRRAATLTPEQCRVLRAAEANPQGLLPYTTTLTTRKPLLARGLITPLGSGWVSITGTGRGVFAEHLRRFG